MRGDRKHPEEYHIYRYRMECLQKQLCALIDKFGYSSDEVLKVSEELDEYILLNIELNRKKIDITPCTKTDFEESKKSKSR